MKYQITIKKIETKTVTKQGAYTVIDTKPWAAELLDDEVYGGKEQFLKSNPLKEIRGYAPSYEGIETVETEVLKQTVETLDLAAVIKAINGL
jgi:hypothetical protein